MFIHRCSQIGRSKKSHSWVEGQEETEIYDRNIGTEIGARPWSAGRVFLSSILLSKLRALSVALVVFCSVGRIGPSGASASSATRSGSLRF